MAQSTSRLFRFALLLGLCVCGPLSAHADPPVRKEVKALVVAAMKDDTITMERLIAQGVSVNTPVEDGRSLLFYAIAYQRVKTVTFLLAHGADLHAKDREGKTPLHWAVIVSTPLTNLLLEKGAEVDATDKSGEPPLFQAILHSPERALALIDHGASVMARNNKSETPLHVAIFGAEEGDLVKKLIAKGADVNAVDQDGQTPLDQTFDSAIASILIAHGATHGQREIATLTSSPLITTLPATPTPIVLTTRLRRAIESDDLYAVQTLLAKGADANAPDFDTSTPLAMALRVNVGSVAPTPPVPAILQALFAKGADINAKTAGEGRTLLIRSVLAHQPASLAWLLAQGANVKVRDTQLGATALNYADDPATIRALFKRGANIDAQDKEGYTSLMTNARDGKTEVVRALLSLHAHIDLKNKRGETALTVARAAQAKNKKRSLQGIFFLLKQAGAK